MLARGGPALGLGNFIAESLIAKLVDKMVSFICEPVRPFLLGSRYFPGDPCLF